MGNCLALCIPRRCSGSPVSETGDGGAESRASSCIADKEQLAAGVTRIKLVITKQQLQDLLRKQVSVEEVVAGVENRAFCSATAWKPKLESIPEGSE
ncbi:uncharacterized protein LOC131146054 [Malania oleifera]|uniref:uncharacterized protein LOC131146054 n=1 Tax=Malania oleifera TaxID=397392 RepID=UPI0025AE46B6|nr:uncharacterized protein LOC131146054 [Malania oleifera]